MRWVRALNPTIIWIIGGLIAVTVGFYVVEKRSDDSVQDAQETINAHIQRSAIEACRRGNLQRAYELANHSDGFRRQALVQDLQPIVNCQQSVKQHTTRLVSKAVQSQYVRIVVHDRRWPILDADGQIVRSRPLPSASQERR